MARLSPDPRHLIKACQVVDEAAAACSWRHEIGRRAAERFTDGGLSMNDVEAALVRGLDVELTWHGGATRLALPWLDPNWPDGAGDPEEWFPVWRAAVGHVVHPAVRAMLNDLLWSVRHQPRPDECGRAAVRDYIAEPPPGWPRHEVRRSLQRACDLAREVKDAALLDLVATRILSDASTAASAGDAGEALMLIEHLVGGRHGATHRTAADTILDQLWQQDTSARLLERMARARLASLDSTERDARVDRVVEAYRSEAADEQGFARLQHLREAARVAEEWGSPRHGEVIHQIEVEDIEDSFERVTTENRLPRAEIDRFVAMVVGTDTLLDALTRFSWQLFLKARDVAEIRDSMPVSIRHVVTSELIGEANSVITSTSHDDEEDYVAKAMDRDAKRGTAHGALLAAHAFLAPALRQSLVTYEPWDEADVAKGLRANGLCDEIVADALARALRHFAEGRFDEALHIAMPRVERLVRLLARATGVPTTKRPTAKVGGIRGLGELLAGMREVGVDPGSLSDDLLSAVELTLVDPDALNLRNNAEHGISGIAGPAEAALIIQLGLLLSIGIDLTRQRQRSA